MSEFEKIPMEQLRFTDSNLITRKLAERGHWQDVRQYYNSKVNEAQQHIESLNDEIIGLRELGHEKTETAYDVRPLKQSLLENISDRILKALDRFAK